MRPIFVEFPETTKNDFTSFLFMFGNSFLVKPGTYWDDE